MDVHRRGISGAAGGGQKTHTDKKEAQPQAFSERECILLRVWPAMRPVRSLCGDKRRATGGYGTAVKQDVEADRLEHALRRGLR